MYEVKEVTGVVQLLKNKKEVKGVKHWAKYGLYLIENGGSLSDIPDAEGVPLFGEILIALDEMPKELTRAEETRLRLFKEDLHKLSKVFRENPTPDNKDAVVALTNTYEKFLKQAKVDTSVFINVDRKFPEKFWDYIEPENPLSDEDKQKWEEMMKSNI